MVRKTIVLLILIWFTQTDLQMINTRRSYYPNKFIAKLYENKLWVSLDKTQEQGFRLIDPNRYLFAGHPRENAKRDNY